MDRIMERASTIGPYIASTLNPDPDNPISSGRGYHIRVGLAIAKDHPIAGVGYLNYGWYFVRQYQFEVGGRERLFTSPRSPHSSHVGILADLGLIGFTLWLLLLFAVGMRYSVAAWRISKRHGLLEYRFMAESLMVSFGLHALPYGMYQPNQQDKILWVLLPMTFAAYRLVVAAAPRLREEPVREWHPQAPRLRLGPALPGRAAGGRVFPAALDPGR
jgi:hypothetical protein